MTSYEMVSDLAGRLGDPSFDRFTEQEMRHWLNTAQVDVERRLNGINAEWLLTQAFTSAYGGTEYYTLPADCHKVRSIRCSLTMWSTTGTSSYRWPRLRLIEDESEEGIIDWEATSADVRWYQISTRIRLNPIPTNSADNALVISYMRRVPDLTVWDDTETSVIRPEYHDLIVGYAEILARRREGTDTAQLLLEYGQAFQDLKASADVQVR